MPRLLWLMFQVPMSSPQMTRIFGFWPPVWASALPIEVTGLGERADAAASVVPASSMLRRLNPWQQDESGGFLLLIRLLYHWSLERDPIVNSRQAVCPATALKHPNASRTAAPSIVRLRS